MWNLDEKQKKKYEIMMNSWLEKYLTIENLKMFQKDYKEIQQIVQEIDTKYLNMSEEDRIKNVYGELAHIMGVNQIQPLNEVVAFDFWDIDYNSIEVSIIFEDNRFRVSEFFNGFIEDEFEPFEDIHIDVLNKIVDKKISV